MLEGAGKRYWSLSGTPNLYLCVLNSRAVGTRFLLLLLHSCSSCVWLDERRSKYLFKRCKGDWSVIMLCQQVSMEVWESWLWSCWAKRAGKMTFLVLQIQGMHKRWTKVSQQKPVVVVCYSLPNHLVYGHTRPVMRCLSTKFHIFKYVLLCLNHHGFECSEEHSDNKTVFVISLAFVFGREWSWRYSVLLYLCYVSIHRLNQNAVWQKDCLEKLWCILTLVVVCISDALRKFVWGTVTWSRCTCAVACMQLSWGLTGRHGRKKGLAPSTWGLLTYLTAAGSSMTELTGQEWSHNCLWGP